MVSCREINMALRNVQGKLWFQIGFPLLVQTDVVGDGFSRVAPSIGLLSFVFINFILV